MTMMYGFILAFLVLNTISFYLMDYATDRMMINKADELTPRELSAFVTLRMMVWVSLLGMSTTIIINLGTLLIFLIQEKIMKYCIVDVIKCTLGEEYVQNHYNCRIYDTRKEAEDYLAVYNAKPLTSSDNFCVPDIRGKIINERGEIYGYRDANDHPHYFALVEMEENRRNAFITNNQKPPTNRQGVFYFVYNLLLRFLDLWGTGTSSTSYT